MYVLVSCLHVFCYGEFTATEYWDDFLVILDNFHYLLHTLSTLSSIIISNWNLSNAILLTNFFYEILVMITKYIFSFWNRWIQDDKKSVGLGVHLSFIFCFSFLYLFPFLFCGSTPSLSFSVLPFLFRNKWSIFHNINLIRFQ